MDIVTCALDASNIFFLFYGIIYFSKVLLFSGKPYFLIFYILVITMNIFVTYAIIKTKDRCISEVMTAFRRSKVIEADRNRVNCSKDTESDGAEEDDVEDTLRSSIHLNDLIEYSFGRFGRILADCSLCLLLFLAGIGELCLLATCHDHFSNKIHYTPFNNSSRQVIIMPCSPYDFNSLPTFLAIAILPILLGVVIVKKLRHCGGFSIIGLVCSVVGTVNFIIYLQYPIGIKTTDLFVGNRAFEMYSFANTAIQFAVWVLPIHNSMSRTRKQFLWFFPLSSIFTYIMVLIIGCFVLNVPSNVNITWVLTYLIANKPIRVIIIMAIVSYYFFLAIPLTALIERRLYQNRRRRRLAHVDLGEYAALTIRASQNSNMSLFLRIRTLNVVEVTKREIEESLSEDDFPKSRYILRFFIFASQTSIVCLCLYLPQITFVFLVIEICATLFIGYALPVALLFPIKRTDVRRRIKLIGVVIIVLALVMTVFAYKVAIQYFINYGFAMEIHHCYKRNVSHTGE